jgi:hypothetical protein
MATMIRERDTPSGLPATCRIAFKEWDGVCEALAGGRQSIILRKGGIDERPGGFAPEHDVFWLYPTRVHQAQQGLKPEVSTKSVGLETPNTVAIHALCVVKRVARIDQPEGPSQLDDLHVWTADTVEKRFNYRNPGLWVLVVRVYVSDRSLTVAVTPEQAGCKSWVEFSEPLPTRGLEPAIPDESFERVMARFEASLNTPR